jgi:hypothetical protein
MATAPRVPWYRKKRGWALIAPPIVLIAVLFFTFDAIVDRATRHELKRIKGYELTFNRARLHPLKLSFEMSGFKAIKASAGGNREPMVFAEEVHFGVLGKELLHGHVVGRLDVFNPKVNVIAARSKAQQQSDELPDLALKLNDMAPLRVDRIQVRRGEFTFIDKTRPEAPRVWLHGIEATVENLSTRAGLARGEPTVVAMHSGLQKKGELSAYVTADPLAKGLWFSGEAKAVGLDMRDFHDLIASRSGLALSEGTLDVFIEFSCRGDRITGGVRPVLKNPQVIQAKKGVENWFKKGLADAALKIFSDRVEGRNAVATTLPIEGKIESPDVQLWPTLFGVVRNAFVEGVTESYERLPPPRAQGREGVLKQAAESLNKQKNAPKAQPEKKK